MWSRAQRNIKTLYNLDEEKMDCMDDHNKSSDSGYDSCVDSPQLRKNTMQTEDHKEPVFESEILTLRGDLITIRSDRRLAWMSRNLGSYVSNPNHGIKRQTVSQPNLRQVNHSKTKDSSPVLTKEDSSKDGKAYDSILLKTRLNEKKVKKLDENPILLTNQRTRETKLYPSFQVTFKNNGKALNSSETKNAESEVASDDTTEFSIFKSLLSKVWKQ